ncbi:MAG: hypothetical protein ACFB14_01875 [Leptolyngbyaceae cyanobacterium]
MQEIQTKNGLDRDLSKRLNSIKVMLLMLILGLFLAGKGVTLWPLVNWPMYSNWRTPFPESSRDIVELRLLSKSGESQRLLSSDIMPFDRKNVAETLIKRAFSEEDTQSRKHNRIALLKLLKSDGNLNNPKTVQAWQLRWAVEPLKLPPLEQNFPEEENLVGTFEVKDYLSSAQ